MLLFGFSDKKTLSIDPLGIVPDERNRVLVMPFFQVRPGGGADFVCRHFLLRNQVQMLRF